MNKSQFVLDIMELRKRAREHIERGAVTSSYQADPTAIINILNEALATEILCTLRYKRHYFMAQGIHSQAVADEFLEHANEEMAHADMLAERIVQLGGEPDFDPLNITKRSHSQYVEGTDLLSMIQEDLVAERIAIDSYRAIIQFIGDSDPTTKRIFETILAVEEEHADDLVSLLQEMDWSKSLDQSTPSSSTIPHAHSKKAV